MLKISFLNLLISYIKRNIKAIILSGIFAITFAVVFSLYSLPIEAVVYAVVLCTAIGFCFITFDFISFYNHHKLLYEMMDCITLSIDNLPDPLDLLEQDYQTLIQIIHNEKLQVTSNADNIKSDMIEYYTLWAHQIKNPIAAMRLLLQSSESEQNTVLLMELFKIEQYVQMVLQYLQLDSTSTDYILKQYSLDCIIKQAVRKYSNMFILKKIKLDFKLNNCMVLTDEKWLTFVVEQILSNALKYTNEGTISIYTESVKTLVIEDTGIGIQAEDIPRVFEKGFTGYNGRIDKKSTGIGLYMCKRILTNLSHTISIESEVYKGTKVKIGLEMINMMVE